MRLLRDLELLATVVTSNAMGSQAGKVTMKVEPEKAPALKKKELLKRKAAVKLKKAVVNKKKAVVKKWAAVKKKVQVMKEVVTRAVKKAQGMAMEATQVVVMKAKEIQFCPAISVGGILMVN